MATEADHGLDVLLALDGVSFFADSQGRYRVRFVVRRVEASTERPHGLNYSLTLHDEKGDRLIGFDNAHPVATRSGPAGRQRVVRDHRHRDRTVRPYDYRDAVTLIADFWQEVDAVLKEKGILP